MDFVITYIIKGVVAGFINPRVTLSPSVIRRDTSLSHNRASIFLCIELA
jgi:hypothetical protein